VRPLGLRVALATAAVLAAVATLLPQYRVHYSVPGAAEIVRTYRGPWGLHVTTMLWWMQILGVALLSAAALARPVRVAAGAIVGFVGALAIAGAAGSAAWLVVDHRFRIDVLPGYYLALAALVVEVVVVVAAGLALARRRSGAPPAAWLGGGLAVVGLVAAHALHPFRVAGTPRWAFSGQPTATRAAVVVAMVAAGALVAFALGIGGAAGAAVAFGQAGAAAIAVARELNFRFDFSRGSGAHLTAGFWLHLGGTLALLATAIALTRSARDR
jgi:hypothetical protein